MARKKSEPAAVKPEGQDIEVSDTHPQESGSASKPVSRRRMLGWTVGSALAGVILGQGVSTGRAASQGGLVVEVDVDLDTYDAMREPEPEAAVATGPFHILGSIYPDGTLNEDGFPPPRTNAIGNYRCWGWTYDGINVLASVTQIFELDGLGQINVQGQDFADKAIIGGMGLFKAASGEMLWEPINMESLAFRAHVQSRLGGPVRVHATRRDFLKRLGVGLVAGSGLVAVGTARAQEVCERVNGSGSYLLGPFDPVEPGMDPVYLVSDLGFDETMLFCKVSTNYQPFRFPTASMGVVEFGPHEFFMDMQSLVIERLQVEETDLGLTAVYKGAMRSETRIFSGDRAQTFVEESISFGCRARHGPVGDVAVSEANFAMTAHFTPGKEHAAIFGEEVTFAGQVTTGNITVI